MNSLEQLAECGQSLWLDYLERSLITRGGLHDLIRKSAQSVSAAWAATAPDPAPDRLIILPMG